MFSVRTNHTISPVKIAASASRSSVESRNAPHGPERPDSRAITPSSASENAKTMIAMVPANRCPVGNSHSAEATTPTVPTIVTASGETPIRSRKAATGVNKRVTTARSRPNI
ncbi:hypothetical protein D3C74_370760 [compost metagenome]